ncbi:acyl-CoA reductase [candidate division TA06 bacterium B3_TA06]|uniref:Acyl-CoA reductase n=1 Tax=candidate division TA06 bacterium B3_TA06 TaxID=2012487 RepID=A0A532V994_UNCT6|nr:MAG: acyl-CoA reductase [candidate division TA06 bacterium B3_TA06]
MRETSIPAFFLPEVAEADLGEFTTLEFGQGQNTVRMHSPLLTPALLSKIIAQLKEAREEYLAKLPVYEIIETIDKAVALWRDPDYPLRRKAEALLPLITGYSSEMITQTLDEIVLMLRGEDLKLLLEEELGDPLFLDQFRPRPKSTGMCKVYGPRLTTAVFAGNVPGLPVANIVYALLMKSAILGKSSSEEPLFGVLFAQTLAEIDPELARSVAMVCWKGGDVEIEHLAFGSSDAVVVYGGEHSVNEVRKRVPFRTRFIAYGHKLSFGVIGREHLAADRVRQTAAWAAVDASVFDQQGCLSPHVFYVEEGGQTTPKEFARLLASEMEAFNQKIPRGRISPDESAHINQLRGSYEFREFEDQGVALHASSRGTDWTVIYERDPAFVPSCLNRTIRIKPVKDVSEVVGLIEPIKGYLQTVGAALPQERFLSLANKMGQLGADRICPLGKMTAPSLTWHHDGRFNILDLLRWTDIEQGST